jgi:hypothetical protein
MELVRGRWTKKVDGPKKNGLKFYLFIIRYIDIDIDAIVMLVFMERETPCCAYRVSQFPLYFPHFTGS